MQRGHLAFKFKLEKSCVNTLQRLNLGNHSVSGNTYISPKCDLKSECKFCRTLEVGCWTQNHFNFI